MQNVFYSLRELDKRAEEDFNLKNGILMENAARGSAEKIKNLFPLKKGEAKKTLQILCGSGDNGGDGLALARILADDFNLHVVLLKEPKSELCKLQYERLKALNIKTAKNILPESDLLFDAFLGTGLKGFLKDEDKKTIEKINKVKAFKIACDIPSGLNLDGEVSPDAVVCNSTFSMGALKEAFYSDEAKDITGKIEVIDLGLPRSSYEKNERPDVFLLEKEDLKLPSRKKQNTHKGTFGHAGIIMGEKSGASLLAASAALEFGSGLVTLIGENPESPKNLKADFMYDGEFKACKSGINKFTSLAIGQGLGRKNDELFSILKIKGNRSMPMVLDADIFYYNELKEILPKLNSAVLTPHPKEFSSLLNIAGLGNLSIEEIQKKRIPLALTFSKKFPKLVLVLKGANTLIAHNGKIFINTLGSPALSKAGSGDVLTGLICSLLAQGYRPLDAAITGSLAHSLASQNTKASYSLTASKLIKNLEKLEGEQLEENKIIGSGKIK
ncbi:MULTISPECIES: NAD(P)H-hydrate dehydratase [unclassified Treponema]|uniref:NAD(P)H-hydrate dehydratase n=1 Tax=unclassified Treponema TaxID=2638727 RepID=UPI0020A52116|nr:MULTISPECIES: NAD(P)H-hydrate dehydratase [unclassified Treponema]UTC68313.1 NAD(P)H-hydrate dehydratase [Treponema sp. OMZ 789]UTC71034.1 NAD(P)H-hydrate dehydratase [Treponema sp. OMZ 790]UTC73775.1 NAD(P)H-hydrate dehydratase [Treponema sp. OMZ 791]